MSSNFFIAWLGFMVPLVYSAGPNNLMCAATGAQAGFKKTLPFIVGVNVSLILLSMSIGFGIGAITNAVPWLSKVVTVAGSFFLLYLAFKMMASGPAGDGMKKVRIPNFWDGFVLNSLNPKGIIGLSIMFNQFIQGDNPLITQVIGISFLTVLISSTAHFLWAGAGNALSSYVRSEKGIKIQGYVFGIMLAGVALWMLFY